MSHDLVLEQLHDADASWNCGCFGAIAEFHRDPDEAVEISQPGGAFVATTDRGAIRVEALPQLRPVAYETISKCIESWGQGVALCLPADLARMSGSSVLTELGPDTEALREQDRQALLFDLGIGGEQAEICVRTADSETIALLRTACGQPFLSQGQVLRHLPRLSPHRVFCCRLGRVEVFQPIPPPDGTSPEGPHTHVLPRLLAHGRGQAATVPVPDGWLAGMSLYPAHPLLRESGETTAFDAARYEAFQAIMERYGDRALMAGKQAALAGSADDVGDALADDSRQRAIGFRISQRQRQWLRPRGDAPIVAKS
jgi:hypothetical protein